MINLGSPDSTDIPDVKRYLDEFLMDERVIEYNYFFRSNILPNCPPPIIQSFLPIKLEFMGTKIH